MTSVRRGRPPTIGVEDILTALIDRLDSQWTVASIAADLGVSDSAIYHYFPSKNAILGAVAERLLAAVALPTYEGDWERLLLELGHRWHGVFVRYPVLLDLETLAGTATGSQLALSEHVLREVMAAGFPLEDAVTVVGVLTSVVIFYARTAVIETRSDIAPAMFDVDCSPRLALALALPLSPEHLLDDALRMVVAGAAPRRRVTTVQVP